MAWPIIGPLLSLLSTGVEKYAENKKLKSEQRSAIEQAKLNRLLALDQNDADWDKLMAEGSKSSWKDEYWTIVLSLPAILAFFPSMVDSVTAGFVALDGMPAWYKMALGTAIAAAFGRQQLVNYMNGKK